MVMSLLQLNYMVGICLNVVSQAHGGDDWEVGSIR